MFTKEIKAFKRGHTVELKQEKGQLVVVELERKVKSKTSIIG